MTATSEPRAERPHMPDYGVDDPAWSPLPWSWAAERLTSCRNFWLTTVSGGGRPHSMPVWGVWDEASHTFGFACALGARKARNLSANPNAVVAVDDTVECVSVEGRADPVTDEAAVGALVDRYLAKYRPVEPSLDAAFLRANLLYEFRPRRAFGIIERAEEFALRATRWRFGGD